MAVESRLMMFQWWQLNTTPQKSAPLRTLKGWQRTVSVGKLWDPFAAYQRWALALNVQPLCYSFCCLYVFMKVLFYAKSLKCSSDLPGMCLCILPFSSAPEARSSEFLVCVSPAFLSHRSQQFSVYFAQSEHVTDRLCCSLFRFVSGSITSKSMVGFATWVRLNQGRSSRWWPGEVISGNWWPT